MSEVIELLEALVRINSVTIVFGPTGAGHHGTGEWVDVASVESCVDVIAEIIREFCA